MHVHENPEAKDTPEDQSVVHEDPAAEQRLADMRGYLEAAFQALGGQDAPSSTRDLLEQITTRAEMPIFPKFITGGDTRTTAAGKFEALTSDISELISRHINSKQRQEVRRTVFDMAQNVSDATLARTFVLLGGGDVEQFDSVAAAPSRPSGQSLDNLSNALDDLLVAVLVSLKEGEGVGEKIERFLDGMMRLSKETRATLEGLSGLQTESEQYALARGVLEDHLSVGFKTNKDSRANSAVVNLAAGLSDYDLAEAYCCFCGGNASRIYLARERREGGFAA